jgi:hypothetical protein
MVTTSNTDLSLPSKKIQFRVSIKQADDWKIRSIAKYKQRQAAKAKLSQSLSATVAASSKAPMAAQAASSNNNNSEKKTARKSKVSESSEGSEKGAAPAADTQTNSRTEITAFQKQQQLDIWIRELEFITQSSAASKERIRQLHLARSQLLWLLKNAARHERNLVNENLSEFAVSNS